MCALQLNVICADVPWMRKMINTQISQQSVRIAAIEFELVGESGRISAHLLYT